MLVQAAVGAFAVFHVFLALDESLGGSAITTAQLPVTVYPATYSAITGTSGSDAITVAFLGRLNPLGILFASLLMALLYLGGEQAQMTLNLPLAITQLFQGMMLFFLLACDVLILYRPRLAVRWGRRNTVVAPMGAL